MIVSIKGTEYEYESDYPSGWTSSSSFYKFPVNIGNHPCFIKRLDKRDPASISGWDLLVSLEKKYEPNLARIYDIKSVEEKGKRVHYVFYECLKGNTLGKLIDQNMPVDLGKLAKDLFQAVASLQKHDYWFADFFENNIFLEESGRSVLVDLDSAQPVSKPPAANMYGSRNYWGPVFNFYTKILNYKDLKVSDLSGLTLNHLQIIFLILRLKILSDTEQEQEEYSETLVDLHSKLDRIDPSFRALFIKLYDQRENPEHLEFAAEIEDLIIQKIVDYTSPPPAGQNPYIKTFTASTHTVENGESFELNWEVINAGYVELFENGAPDKKFMAGETGTTKTMFYDGGAKVISYKLVAYKNDKEVESDPVNIQFRNPKPGPVDIKIEKFTASRDTVNNGESFELSWKVKDAAYVELYENGSLDTKFTAGETSIKKTAYNDGGTDTISYKLMAYKGDVEVESSPVYIKFKKIIPLPKQDLRIENFTANPDAVKSGESFRLSWEVKNADYLELYVNEVFDTKFTTGETSIQKTADFTGASKIITCKIIAYNSEERMESELIEIRQKQPTPPPPDIPKPPPPPPPIAYYLKRIGIPLLVLLVIASVIKWWPGNHSNKPVILAVAPKRFYRTQPITIYGRDFPTNLNDIIVVLNKVRADIQSHSADSLVVAYPESADSLLERGVVRVGIVVHKDTLYATNTIMGKYMEDNANVNTAAIDSSAPLVDAVTKHRNDSIATSEWLKRRSDSIAKIRQGSKITKLLLKNRNDSIKRALALNAAKPLEPAKNVDDGKKAEDDKRSLWEKNKYTLVTVVPKYKDKGLLGGVKDVKLTVTNNSDYHLDIVVNVSYLKKETREKKHMTLSFPNVPPHTSPVFEAPNGPGDKVSAIIESMKPREFN